MFKKFLVFLLGLFLLFPNIVYATYPSDDLLNMILGGTPVDEIWQYDDNNLIIVDAATRTKSFGFSCNLLGATPRILSAQDASYTIAGTNIAQTFSGLNTFSVKQTFGIPTSGGTTDPRIETASTVTSGLAGGFGNGIWNLSPTLSNAGDDVGTVVGIRTNINIDNATDNSYRGIQLVLDVQSDGASHTGNNTISGLDFISRTSGVSSGGVISSLRGIVGSAQHNATGGDILSNLNAIDMQISSGVGSGPVTTANGIRFSSVSVRSAWTDLALFRGINPTISGGSLGTLYGLNLPNLTAATTNWAIFSQGGNSSHLGPFKFGANTAPTHRLDIAAGTTTIAPIKMTSATAITTPVAGCVEFTTDDYFATITTGAARKGIVLDDGARLTSGTTPVATTNGRLIDGLILASGVYTPTLTGVTNVAASTAYEWQYMRVGNTVTFSGKVDIDVTAVGNTQLGISLPIASNFGAQEDCAGTGHGIGNALAESGALYGDATNNRAEFNLTATSLTNNSWFISATYQIIP